MRKTMFALTSLLALLASPALAQQTPAANPNAPAADTSQNAAAQTTPAQTDQSPRAAGQRAVQRDAQRAAQRDGQRAAQRDGQGQRGPAMRASDIDGLTVRNTQNEDLGTIDDLVIDLRSGRIRYAAMSVGGVLGIGDNLYAVPWAAFRMEISDNDESVLILNATKEQLENAPGFNKDQWPNVGDPQWRNTNDSFYSDQGIVVTRRDGDRARGAAGDRPNTTRPDRGLDRDRSTQPQTDDLPARGDRQRTPAEAQNTDNSNPNVQPPGSNQQPPGSAAPATN